jgi:hypothetical protein
MGGACSTNWGGGRRRRRRRMHIGYRWESQKERVYCGDLHVGGRMDLGWIEWVDMDWINLAQDKYQWWALVNTLMNVLAP